MFKFLEKESLYVTQVRQILSEKSLKFTYDLRDKETDSARHVWKIVVEYSEDLIITHLITFHIKKKLYNVLSYYPKNVKPERREVAAEIVARQNQGIRVGCYEIDLSDGEVKFRISFFVGEAVQVKGVIADSLDLCLHTTEKIFRGFKIAFEGTAPAKECWAMIQGESKPAVSDGAGAGGAGAGAGGAGGDPAELLKQLLDALKKQ